MFNDEFESLRLELLDEDGWVSYEEYKEAKTEFDQRKGDLKNLREKLDELALIDWCTIKTIRNLSCLSVREVAVKSLGT